ncbi:MAG: tyrosine--tRNA ligase [Nitrospirae bacterium]|nr:tyrosine--tRNA ligase [Nitrospirota bacterium]
MDISTLLDRGTIEVVVRGELEKKLKAGKKLRIKFGIDPTGSDLHIGHAVVLKKMREFQDAGHQVILLIGDFTAKIGDPTGRTETRKALTDKEIQENMKSYTDQAGLILDMDNIEVRYNSEWLGKLKMGELLELASLKTVAQLLHRSDFKKRMKENIDISLSEFLYPIMQGYDSVVLKSDVELGGTEQTFNMLVGRDLQKHYGQPQQDVMTVPILEGLDGVEKMSKSYNNYIGLTETPKEMYGKTLSIPDEMITKYFELATNVSLDDIKKIKKALEEGENPKNLKMRLAREIVTLYHNENAATQAEKEFEQIFKNKGLPEDIEVKHLKEDKWNIIELIAETELSPSKSETRRMIQGGGVKVDGEKVRSHEEEIDISKERLVQVGKRKFIKVIST